MAKSLYGITVTLSLSCVIALISYQWLVGVTILSIILWRIQHALQQKMWRCHCDGFVAPGFEKVLEAFRRNIETKQEQGGAFAVYYKGNLVVDIWGGYADARALRLRKQNTLSFVYSATKVVTAICMAMLVDRGLLDYTEPVSRYWPEFGVKKKESITVETLLSHKSGLITSREKYKLAWLRDDPEKLCHLLARQEPFWEPGSGIGYDALTYGLYADFLLRKVDKQGRSLSQFFQEEIAEPFDIDFYIGLPRSEMYRTCRESNAHFGVWFIFTTVIPTGIRYFYNVAYSLIKFRKYYIAYLFGSPTDWHPRRVNDTAFREIGCGASHGFGTASALAKLMGILANGGKHNGQTLLSQGAIERLNTPVADGYDRVVLRNFTYGPGSGLKAITNQSGSFLRYAFGHWGAGGQIAYCDPGRKVGWAYITNFSNLLHGYVVDHRYAAVEKALFQCLDELDRS